MNDINKLIEQYPDLNVTLRAGELAQLVEHVIEKAKEAFSPKKEEETYLTTEKTAEMLDVDRSTLWRWNKIGYLKHISVGGKRRYRLSDIERILNEK